MKRDVFGLILLNIIQAATSYGQRALFAYYFGTSAELDVYYISSIIPGLLVFFFSAIGTATVPTVSRLEENGGHAAARRLWGQLFWLNALLLLVLLPLALWQAPAIIKLTSSNLHPNHERLAVRFARYMLTAQFGIQGLSYFLQSLLTYRGRFFISRVGALIPAVVMIASVGLLARSFGTFSAVLAVLIGNSAQLLLTVIAARKDVDFAVIFVWLRSSLRFKAEGLAPVLAQTLPVMMLSLNARAMTAADAAMASAIGAGAVSIYSYAYGIFQIPQLIFTQASTMVKIPDIFKQAARGNHKLFAESIYQTIDTTLLLILPSTAGLLILREPLVRLLLEHGSFTASETQAVSQLLLYFGPVSVLWALWLCLGNPLIALQRTKTALTVEVSTTVLSIVMNYLLRPILDLKGLVLSTIIAMSFMIASFLLILRKELPELKLWRIATGILKQSAATALMSGVCLGLLALLELLNRGVLIRILIVGLSGAIFYFLSAAYLFNIADALRLIRPMTRPRSNFTSAD